MSYLALLDEAERELGITSREPAGRCPACRRRIAAGTADSLCQDCPDWEPIFDRVVPREVFERVRAMRACAECRRLGDACHEHEELD